MNIIDSIIEKLNTRYNGSLDCDKQQADLFVYIDGNEVDIIGIDTEMIYFEYSEYNVSLWDADIHHLAYINEVI
jgi:hypothetical protein